MGGGGGVPTWDSSWWGVVPSCPEWGVVLVGLGLVGSCPEWGFFLVGSCPVGIVLVGSGPSGELFWWGLGL